MTSGGAGRYKDKIRFSASSRFVGNGMGSILSCCQHDDASQGLPKVCLSLQQARQAGEIVSDLGVLEGQGAGGRRRLDGFVKVMYAHVLPWIFSCPLTWQTTKNTGLNWNLRLETVSDK